MAKRLVEVFTSGCYLCNDVVNQVKELACDNCEGVVFDLNKGYGTNECEAKEKQYGIRSVPAVAINGELDCYKNNGIDIESLKEAGLGK